MRRFTTSHTLASAEFAFGNVLQGSSAAVPCPASPCAAHTCLASTSASLPAWQIGWNGNAFADPTCRSFSQCSTSPATPPTCHAHGPTHARHPTHKPYTRGNILCSNPRQYTNMREPVRGFCALPAMSEGPSRGQGGASTSGGQGEGVVVECDLGTGNPIVFEARTLAPQAEGSCLVRCGGVQLLATAVTEAVTEENRWRIRADQDMLQVEYRERMYAVGRIPGGYLRREGQPSEHETGVAAAVARALRPHLPQHMAQPLEICLTVLSSDGETDTVPLAITAASAAIALSRVPWPSPVAAVRVMAQAGGGLRLGPPASALESAGFAMLIAGTGERVAMLDAEGQSMSEELVSRAARLAMSNIARLAAAQAELAAMDGVSKGDISVGGADPAALVNIEATARPLIEPILARHTLTRCQQDAALRAACQELVEKLRAKGYYRMAHMRVPGSGCANMRDITLGWRKIVADVVRDMAFNHNLRVDGRGLVDVRPLDCRVGELAGAHGSAVVVSGDGQALAAVTVGSRSAMLETESLFGSSRHNLIVHTAQPPFANNMVGHPRLPRWQEAGHAHRLEAALGAHLPSSDSFSFALRVNADMLAADGGVEALATSAASLALRDAGAPLDHLVAGVNVGLFMECPSASAAPQNQEGGASPRWEMLSDVTALEEEAADAEITAAASASGFTALHLDTRMNGGLEVPVLEAAIRRCRDACSRTLSYLERTEPSHATAESGVFGRVVTRKELVGRIIGPGGSNIKGLERDTGAKVVVDDEGVVQYYASNAKQAAAVEAALDAVSGASIKEGSRHTVKVVKLTDFGAFVEFNNGVQALLHISELAHVKVRAVEDVLGLGMVLDVLVLPRDMRGQLKVSRKAVLPNPSLQASTTGPVPPPSAPRNPFSRVPTPGTPGREGASSSNAPLPREGDSPARTRKFLRES